MSKSKFYLPLLLAVFLVAAVAVVEIYAQSTTAKPSFVISKVESQVVLYTLYRGDYSKIGPAIGKLFALAGQKGIIPRGPVCCAYLNNPKKVSSEHWLTEIRIPVGKEALKLAGTLGDFTDIKTLPAQQVATAEKTQGIADPSPIYESLSIWIFKQGYILDEGFSEIFLTDATAADYSQMKTKIIASITKLSEPGR